MNVERDQPPLSQHVLASGAVISGAIITRNSALCLRSLWVQLVSKIGWTSLAVLPDDLQPSQRNTGLLHIPRGETRPNCRNWALFFLSIPPNFLVRRLGRALSFLDTQCEWVLWKANHVLDHCECQISRHLSQLKLGPAQSLFMIYRLVWHLFESSWCQKWLVWLVRCPANLAENTGLLHVWWGETKLLSKCRNWALSVYSIKLFQSNSWRGRFLSLDIRSEWVLWNPIMCSITMVAKSAAFKTI